MRGWSLSRVTPVNMECGRPEAHSSGDREGKGEWEGERVWKRYVRTYVESVAVFGQAVERADGRGTPGPTNSTIRYYNPGNGNVPPAQVQRSDSATYQPRCAPSSSLPPSPSLSLSLRFPPFPPLLVHRYSYSVLLSRPFRPCSIGAASRFGQAAANYI